MTTVLLVLVALIVIVSYLLWTANRIDRLHARVDAAWAALDAQLLRRAAAARVLAAGLPPPARERLDAAARAALDGDPASREECENDLSRDLVATLSDAPADRHELRTAATRVALARSFHNTAVADTRGIRLRRVPRALCLAGHRALPQYFEIDDTRLAGAARPVTAAAESPQR